MRSALSIWCVGTLVLVATGTLLTFSDSSAWAPVVQAIVAACLGYALARYGSVWMACGATALAMIIAAASLPLAVLARDNVAAIGVGPMGIIGFVAGFATFGLAMAALGAGMQRLLAHRSTRGLHRAP